MVLRSARTSRWLALMLFVIPNGMSPLSERGVSGLPLVRFHGSNVNACQQRVWVSQRPLREHSAQGRTPAERYQHMA